MLKLSPIFAVLMIAAVYASGCGGDDQNSSSSDLSKSQFIARADAICKKTDQAQQAAFTEYARQGEKPLSTDAEREDLVMAAGLPPVMEEAEKIEALGAPSGDEGEVGAIVSGIEAAVREAEKDPLSVEEPGKSPFDEVNSLAKKYGFKDCSEPL